MRASENPSQLVTFYLYILLVFECAFVERTGFSRLFNFLKIILTLYILVARLPSASPLVDLQYIYLKLNYLCQWWLCWSAGTRASSSSYSAFSLKSFFSIDFESIQRLKERTREPFNVRLVISDKVFNFQLVFFFL